MYIESLVLLVLRIAKTGHIDKRDPSPLDFLKLDAAQDGYNHFSNYMDRAMIFPARPELRKFAIREALKLLTESKDIIDPLILEFGVAGATSTNHIAGQIREAGLIIHGFDAFVGLEEDWLGMHRGRTAGSYTYSGNLPDVKENVQLVVGWVQDTLPDFLAEHDKGTILFAHFDMDTYSPGRFGLEKIQPHLVAGSIILFDDFYAYPGWRNNDFRSLNELFNSDEYEFIAFSHTQVAIRIL